MSDNLVMDKMGSIKALQAAMLEMPQATLETEHLFIEGVYARILPCPAGTLVVGKVHKREHFYIVTKGSFQVTDGFGDTSEHKAGTVLVSKPGTKRALLALEDSVCMTVHRTDSCDLDEIETELIEPDDTALFDSGNRLRRLS